MQVAKQLRWPRLLSMALDAAKGGLGWAADFYVEKLAEQAAHALLRCTFGSSCALLCRRQLHKPADASADKCLHL